jgi:hypothetical protein
LGLQGSDLIIEWHFVEVMKLLEVGDNAGIMSVGAVS